MPLEKRLHILVVDDSREMCTLLEEGLSVYDTVGRVDTANTVETALELLYHKSYDVLLLDLIMPVRDGIAMLEILRANPPSIMPKIIVFTALQNEQLLAAVCRYGVSFCIIKPFLLDNLIQRILMVVEEPEADREPPADAAQLSKTLRGALHSMEFSPNRLGFGYICIAVESMLHTYPNYPTLKSIYKNIARAHFSSPECVENAIRCAVARAWDKGLREKMQLDAKPSNKVFLTWMTERMLNRD